MNIGSCIIEELESHSINIPVKRFGWPDRFIEHGNSVSELRRKVGLDKNSLQKSIEEFLSLENKIVSPIFA